MIKTWFESKVQYVKIDEISGKEKKVTECFLFDAVSWTEAEARTFEQMKTLTNGEFVVEAIKKSRLSEVFPYDCGEWWFKVGVEMVTIDEEAGKEKKAKMNYLIMADDIQQALNRINESLNDMIVPFEVSNLGRSNIMDVFPYFEEDKEQ